MRISARQLAQTLFDLTDGKLKAETEKSVADFARYIYRNRKAKMTGKIIEQFSAVFNAKKGIVEAEVVTLEKISSDIEKKVEKYIEKKFQAKEVVVKNTVDPKIKGGMIIRVGDEVIDGSIHGKLEELKKALII